MTHQRQLKSLVRDRMARTGESYTTARRHVLRRAAEIGPVPGTLPGYTSFGPEQHRESALARHLLRHRGVDIDEATLAGLAGGIGFLYAIFEYQGLPPIVTIVAQHHPEPWIPAILDRLGIAYTQEHSSSTARAMAALRGALDNGDPVQVDVDRGRLPWHAATPAVASDPYPVVVAGAAGETLLVDDVSAGPHAIGADAFAAAWAVHRKGRHRRLVVTGTPSVALDAATRAAIDTTVAHLTGPVLGNAFDTNFGFSGMAKLAAQLRDTRTRSGWARRFADPAAFGAAMRRLYECLELSYTAPGATRPLYADFLDRAGQAGAAALFREAGALWSALAERAVGQAGAYGELAERRLLLALTGGDVGPVDARIAALPAPEPQLSIFAELADLVDAARSVEERAVALLRR